MYVHRYGGGGAAWVGGTEFCVQSMLRQDGSWMLVYRFVDVCIYVCVLVF